MLKAFGEFIRRGNVLDLAVAVIMGAAFGRIVTSLTEDVLMPVIGRLFGGLDFSSFFVVLAPSKVPPALRDSSDYAALKKAGVPLLGYGEFVTQAVNFLIVAFIVFLIVRAVNRMLAFHHHQEKVETAPAPDAADVVLLREILAELKRRP